MKKKCIIVSNRLPIEYDVETGKIKLSSGGLVSALKGLKANYPVYWLGSLIDFKEKKSLLLEPHLIPIFFEKELYQDYYNKISNDVFWPLFHYEVQMVHFCWDAWESYKKVNLEFAKKIVKYANEEDLIWIHDYHLFLVPQYVKELNPKLKIGFFLHIPFPSSEIFKTLAVREEILHSLLHCSLIGFHDYSYLRHFMNCLHFILGFEEANIFGLFSQKYHVDFGVFPVSIDTQNFLETIKLKKIIHKSKAIHKENKGVHLILGVDRLDYTKGIELKLQALERLLEKYPHLQGKITLLQIAVPSRTDVPIYQNTKNEIDRLVGAINGKYGKPNYVPIKYMYTSISFELLVSLYHVAKSFIITSKRDGMNLVSLEYIASQNEKDPGVLLLSEFTGAISNLSGVIPINPWNIEKTAEALYRSIIMPKKERIQRYSLMIQLLKNYNASVWVSDFLNTLDSVSMAKKNQAILINVNTKDQIEIPKQLKNAVTSGKKIILFLDYDGTLTPIVKNINEAIISKETLDILKKFKNSNKFLVNIISGRPMKFLQNQFHKLNLYLTAEHGSIFYDTKKNHILVNEYQKEWMDLSYSLMSYYSKKVAGSFIEKKKYSISWHYRNSPPIFANYQARNLYKDLGEYLKDFPVTCINGKKIIEIKALEANKGSFIRWFIKHYSFEDYFLVALGDDITDEDMFKTIKPLDGLSIRVGNMNTEAEYYLKKQEYVNLFLNSIHDL